jgi:hypothetical protein
MTGEIMDHQSGRFRVVPRIQAWKVQHTDFDPTWQPRTLS